MNTRNRERADELLLLAQAGDASSPEIEELNSLLRQDESIRSAVAESLVLDAMLIEEFQARDAINHLAVRLDGPEPSQDQISAPVQTRLPGGLFGASVFVVLACVCLAIGWFAGVRYTAVADASSSTTEEESNEPAANSISPAVVAKNVVGTISLSSDSKWVPEKRLGDFVYEGNLKLLSGIGRIHTHRGATVLIDAREKPADITFIDDDTALVSQGSVVAEVGDSALGFTIRTPSTQVVDIGTRFAVNVDSEGSNIEVLEGAVSCLPIEGVPIRNLAVVEQGKALRFDGPQDRIGVAIENDTSRYDSLAKLVDKLDQGIVGMGLIAYEPFHYPKGLLADREGGIGWQGSWHAHTDPSRPAINPVREDSYMEPLKWLNRADGNNQAYVVIPAASSSERMLSSPIPLDEESVYYLSFMLRKQSLAPAGNRGTGSGLALVNTPRDRESEIRDMVFAVSFDWESHLTTSTGKGRYHGSRSLSDGEPYFIVLKLEIHADAPDRIFALAYQKDDPPQVVEPDSWGSAVPPHFHDGNITRIHIWSDQSALAAIDDIRIGTTWKSVVPLRH